MLAWGEFSCPQGGRDWVLKSCPGEWEAVKSRKEGCLKRAKEGNGKEGPTYPGGGWHLRRSRPLLKVPGHCEELTGERSRNHALRSGQEIPRV